MNNKTFQKLGKALGQSDLTTGQQIAVVGAVHLFDELIHDEVKPEELIEKLKKQYGEIAFRAFTSKGD